MKPAGLSVSFPCFAIVLMSLAGCVLEHHDPWEEGDWGPQPGRGGSSGSQPPGSIGSPCARDNECGAGCYCTRDSRVCRHSGSCARDEHCASGFRCDERRTCVPRDPGPVADGGPRPEVGGTGGSGGGAGSTGRDGGPPEAGVGGAGGGTAGAGGMTGTGGAGGMTPPSGGTSGTAGTGGAAPTSCRVDAQCGGGRCVQGACQRPCGADASCGTGHVCKDGFCQPSAQPGGQCLYSAECPAGGACINGYCHAACASTGAASMTAPTTCPNPADRCLQGICKPDVRPVPQCTANAHCPAGRSCVDAVCRTPCRDDSQCGPGCSGTICHAGYCVMPEELQPPPSCPMPCATTACCPVQ